MFVPDDNDNDEYVIEYLTVERTRNKRTGVVVRECRGGHEDDDFDWTDGPAWISRDKETGHVTCRIWGDFRTDGPISIWYDPQTGAKIRAIWRSHEDAPDYREDYDPRTGRVVSRNFGGSKAGTVDSVDDKLYPGGDTLAPT